MIWGIELMSQRRRHDMGMLEGTKITEREYKLRKTKGRPDPKKRRKSCKVLVTKGVQ